MEDSELQLQHLACFVHGLLVFGHALGLVYNLKRKNWQDVIAHSLACGYDLHALNKHLKAVRTSDVLVEEWDGQIRY